jgi:hypothetical protein
LSSQDFAIAEKAMLDKQVIADSMSKTATFQAIKHKGNRRRILKGVYDLLPQFLLG